VNNYETFTATLISGSISESTNGTPCWAIVFEVPEIGRRTVRLWITEKSKPFTIEKLTFLGWNYDIENPVFGNTENVPLSRKYEEYNGKQQEKWDIFNPKTPRPASNRDAFRSFAAEARAIGGPPPRTVKPTAVVTTTQAPATKAPERPKKPTVNINLDAIENADTAWAEYVKLTPGKSEADRSEAFYGAVDKVKAKTKRDEDTFTADDWKEVVASVIPF
jgi:hypothetical protein